MRSRVRVARLFPALAGLALFGCGGGGEQPDSVQAALTTSRSTYSVGEPVDFDYTLTNQTDHPVTVTGTALGVLPDGNLGGIIAFVYRGAEMVYSADVLPQHGGQVVIPPHGAVTAHLNWPQIDHREMPVPPGNYAISATGAFDTVDGVPFTVRRFDGERAARITIR